MRTLLLLASFAFVLSVTQGQGYGSKRPKKIMPPKPLVRPFSHRIFRHKPRISHKPPVFPKHGIHPKPVKPAMHPKPMIPVDPIMPMGGRRLPMMRNRGGLPLAIRNLIGKTITGKDILGGVGRFPRHGGAGIGERFKNGLRNGWGDDPNNPVHQAVSSWVDPLQSRPFDPAFSGGELVFDPNRGMYIAMQQQHQAKKTGAMIGSPSRMVEHSIVKEASHIADKTISGVGIRRPMINKKPGAGSFVGLSQIGGMGPIGTAFVNPAGPIALDHKMAKSSGLGPMGHGIAKGSSGIGMAGMQHDMAKTTMLDIDPFGSPVGIGSGGMRHSIAKSTGMRGVGLHDIAKDSMSAMDPFDAVGGGIGSVGLQHDIIKATSGISPVGRGGIIGTPMLPPVQVKKAGRHPVHNVEKVINSGITSMGHDGLAFDIGSQMARVITHNSARTIDAGSGGAVRMGDPTAKRAVHGLAKEAIHIASETLDLAGGKSGHLGSHGMVGPGFVGGPGTMIGGSRIGMGGSRIGMGGSSIGLAGHSFLPIAPVMPIKPVLPKKPKVPKTIIRGGYGRIPVRRRGWKPKRGIQPKKGLHMRDW